MMKRRTFLLGGAGAAGVLLVGWSVLPPGQRLTTSKPLPVSGTQVALNGWVKIAADSTVTIMMCKSEMGQGVHTGLAMVLADELDADWSQVKVENAPIDGIYNDQQSIVDDLWFRPDDDGEIKRLAVWMVRKVTRDFGVNTTGGSSSINDLWTPMREAGASARAMLVSAAAAKWDVRAADCSVAAGRITHPSGRTASFGELTALAAQQPMPRKVELKLPAQFRIIGKPLRRIEAASKIDGSARFGIDALPDGLLYASVNMCPTLGGTVAHFDASGIPAKLGVIKAFAVPPYNGGTGGVAVIARDMYGALTAAADLKPVWNAGAAAKLSSADIDARLVETLDKESGHAFYTVGDVDAALRTAHRTITAEYRAPYLAHAPVEPVNCTVQFKDGAATVWAATQMPTLARRHVAKVLGIDEDKVDMQTQLLGGAFGRRLEIDFITQAAAIAKEAGGRPVQTLWSRTQDTQHDFYRPACLSRFEAGLDADGKLVAWRNTSAGQAIVPQVLTRTFGLPDMHLPYDKTTSEGAFDQPYEWPNARVAHAFVELPVPVGFWRSVGHSHQAFFTECFMDEVAALAGKDPVEFRAGLLTRHPRHLAVLRSAAALAGWGKPVVGPRGVRCARGIAMHQAFGSIVAQVAEVSLDPDKGVRVHRVVCVIDCGTAVNPNLIAQQMEGGIIFGLSSALQNEITLCDGQVEQTNFLDFPVVRMSGCPAIEVHIMPGDAHPQGVGEPGVPPVAPAVANALFALTGERRYSLPLDPAGVRLKTPCPLNPANTATTKTCPPST
ncbi:MAG: xanthine dehydrogenase family protein molybdopterin-binding subunit [Paraburkholderia sp.]|uniref:xanthine dehydrogenase family protein molybdopterin-binding subunit n=1 Tax=Paraburkholderia sp. TaxID=1926495 RepID=UPI0011FE80F6|nr:xanthine dehydrogenase family protein molybdopterin-binding subunit [Paraburkholderia sp.]TAL99072.1 MAG: xanthine dehydrogenase family protein molybdopterin-binding subunit [Paraburkholderia sp.]